MRRSSTDLLRTIGALAGCAAGAVSVPGMAEAKALRPTVTLSCEFDGGRRHLRASQFAETADDELQCRAILQGLAGDRNLAGELVMVVRRGAPRTVAAGRFEPDDVMPGALIVEDLKVPHSTWLSALRWTKQRRPYLEIVLRVSADRGSGHRWAVVLERAFRIDDRPPTASVRMVARGRRSESPRSPAAGARQAPHR